MKATIIVLRISCILLFIGRAWQHLFWDIPIRELLWDQTWMEEIIGIITGLTWEAYVSSPEIDKGIQFSTWFLGVLYLLGALYLLLPIRYLKKISLLPLYSVLLTFLAFLYWKEKNFFLAEFFEYAAQFLLPIILHLFIKYPAQEKKLHYLLLFSIAITFTAHGLYAVGFYPVPGNFIDMVIVTLGVTETVAYRLLCYMGILDFVLAIAIFFPFTRKAFLTYAFLWGSLTAFSRVWTTFDPELPFYSLHQWTWEVLYRLPHAGLPLAALLLSKVLQNKFKGQADFRLETVNLMPSSLSKQ